MNHLSAPWMVGLCEDSGLVHQQQNARPQCYSTTGTILTSAAPRSVLPSGRSLWLLIHYGPRQFQSRLLHVSRPPSLVDLCLKLFFSPYSAYPAYSSQYITTAAAPQAVPAYQYAYTARCPCPVHDLPAYAPQCTCSHSSRYPASDGRTSCSAYKMSQKIAEQKRYIDDLRSLRSKTLNPVTRRVMKNDLSKALKVLERYERGYW
jgi:hypothetical protein